MLTEKLPSIRGSSQSRHLGDLMELLDTSIANVALPYIGGGLGRKL